jgi:hypothetical protein
MKFTRADNFGFNFKAGSLETSVSALPLTFHSYENGRQKANKKSQRN